MVKEMISDGTGNAVELEGEGDGDTLEVSVYPHTQIQNNQLKVQNLTLHTSVWMFYTCCVLQYEYDMDENGDRVVLGRGTYGVVYAGRDLSNQVRIAIKEIPERDSR